MLDVVQLTVWSISNLATTCVNTTGTGLTRHAPGCFGQLCKGKLLCHNGLTGLIAPIEMAGAAHSNKFCNVRCPYGRGQFNMSRRDWPGDRGSCLTGQPAIDERLVEKGAAAMASMGPTAIPTSAVPRAAKSFRPSPQNRTVCCCPCETTSRMLAAQGTLP